jgi:hypothetical protein
MPIHEVPLWLFIAGNLSMRLARQLPMSIE